MVWVLSSITTGSGRLPVNRVLVAYGPGLTYRLSVALVQDELVGRSAEQSAIAEFFRLGHDGVRCLLLEGEPGIGKTSLWRAARSAAGVFGYRLLSSAPTEVETGLPHAVLGDLLHPVPEEALASLPGPLRTTEFEESLRRLGFGLTLFVQHAPDTVVSISVLEGDEPASALRRLAMSQHPFDRWHLQQIADQTGIASTGPPPPPNEPLWSRDGGAVRARQSAG